MSCKAALTPSTKEPQTTRAWWAASYRTMSSVSALGLLALLRVYKVALSPLSAGSCRFVPSCSDYMAVAVARHGAVLGLNRAIFHMFFHSCGKLWRKTEFDRPAWEALNGSAAL